MQYKLRLTENMEFVLEHLSEYRENDRLEVKSAKGGLPLSIWETYSAFANSEGGVIVLGIKELKDGSFSIEGVNDSAKMIRDFWNMINNRQKVSCNILTNRMVTAETIDQKDIIIIRVPRAERTTRPVFVGLDPRQGSFRRNGEGDYRCTIDEVSLMMRDAGLLSEDNKLLVGITFEALCSDTIQSYRRLFELYHPTHIWNKEEDEVFMRRIGAMREDPDSRHFYVTGAGLLMFGHEYEIIREYPQYLLDYQENRTIGMDARWTDRITSQSADWSGNVLDFIFMILPKLTSGLKVPFVLKGSQRDEDTPLHKILREAMINMLTNADYYGRRGVVIHKDSGGYSFSNPGSMRVSLIDVLQSSISDPRNALMLRMLSLIRFGERAGSGLQSIFKTWQAVYHCTPTIQASADGVDRTTLRLDFNNQTPDIEAMRELYDLYEGHDDPHNIDNDPQKGKNVPQNDKNDPQNGDNDSQKGINVPQNEDNDSQKGINDPQKNHNDPQNVQGVSKSSLKHDYSLLIKIISERQSISRTELSQLLGLSLATIGRHLKSAGIRWEGSAKCGHWIIPT